MHLCVWAAANESAAELPAVEPHGMLALEAFPASRNQTIWEGNEKLISFLREQSVNPVQYTKKLKLDANPDQN